MTEVKVLVTDALRRAFSLGQIYWQQADSEYISQHRKVDATRAKFQELCERTEETIDTLRGIKPEAPPRPPDGNGLPRYGLRWNGPGEPVSVPMDDGYWTPWHLTEMLRAQLAEAQRDSERYHFLAGFGVTAHSPRWAHWRIERWTKDGWEPIYGNLMNAAIDAAKGESNGTVRAERSGFDTLPDDYETGDY